MRIEGMRRWQWAVIGLGIGFVAGWAWSSLATSGGLTATATIGSKFFERALAAKPFEGHPRVKDITVYEDKGTYTARMKVLEPDPKDPRPYNRRYYKYVTEELNSTRPYLPTFADSTTPIVMLRINPSAAPLLRVWAMKEKKERKGPFRSWVNGAVVADDEPGLAISFTGWQTQPGSGSDPGSGADLSLPLRRANYQLHVAISKAQESAGPASDLTMTLNGRPVPPLILVKSGSGTTWETTLPEDAMVAGESQTLRFSRQGKPVRIWEIRLIDQTYTVLDYLAFARQNNPAITYTLAWWNKPWIRYAVSTVAGVLFFGGIWPGIVRRLNGAPSGRSQKEVYDLDRFKGEPPTTKESTTPGAEVDLTELEAQVRKSLEIQAVATNAPRPEQPPAAPVPLASQPVSPALLPEAPPSPAEYQGEYYPVVRPHGDVDRHGG